MKYCHKCEAIPMLDESGYCESCGTHADNMFPYVPTPFYNTADKVITIERPVVVSPTDKADELDSEVGDPGDYKFGVKQLVPVYSEFVGLSENEQKLELEKLYALAHGDNIL